MLDCSYSSAEDLWDTCEQFVVCAGPPSIVEAVEADCRRLTIGFLGVYGRLMNEPMYAQPSATALGPSQPDAAILDVKQQPSHTIAAMLVSA